MSSTLLSTLAPLGGRPIAEGRCGGRCGGTELQGTPGTRKGGDDEVPNALLWTGLHHRGTRYLGMDLMVTCQSCRRTPIKVGIARQIVNTGSEELRFLAMSRKLAPEIAEYPDSGKFGLYAEFPAGVDEQPPVLRFVGRESARVDYSDGE